MEIKGNMKGRYEGSLTRVEIARGIGLCLQNSLELIDDASLLFENGRYARSYALTLLSFEEMGKIPMFASASLFGKDIQLWKKFWKRFRHHVTKRRNVSGLEYLMLPYTTLKQTRREWKAEQHFERLKLFCLYVDAFRGRLISPKELFRGNRGVQSAKVALTLARNRHSLLSTFHKFAKPDRSVKTGAKLKRKGLVDSGVITHRKFLEYISKIDRGSSIRPGVDKPAP
jgi:AbiV family abortive infection protein